MEVKFLQTIEGSIDGSSVKTFEKGNIYKVDENELSDYLFKAWFQKGVLEICKEEVDQKSFKIELDNKSFDQVLENKSIKTKAKSKK